MIVERMLGVLRSGEAMWKLRGRGGRFDEMRPNDDADLAGEVIASVDQG